MLHLDVHRINRNRGVTLTEVVVIVVIIAIMAGMSAPSFLAWLNKQRLSESLASVEGALREAQREAMRQNIQCTISFSPDLPSDNTTLSAIPASCLPTGSRTLGGKLFGLIEIGTINLRGTFNNSTNKLAFRPRRGSTTSVGSLYLSLADSGVQQRCLVVSTFSGLFRTGVYVGTAPTGTIPADCVQP
jgi:Tfp pilus assembly protein FimT